MKLLTKRWQQYLGYFLYFKHDCLVFVLEKPEKVSLHTFFLWFPIDIIFRYKDGSFAQFCKVKPFAYISSREDCISIEEWRKKW